MRKLRRSDAINDMFEQMENLVQNLQGRDLEDVMVDFPVDISHDGNTVTVEAELPGVQRDEIDIKADSETLEISASVDQEVREENEEYIRQERTRRSVHRTVAFPAPVDTSTVEADYEDGVLEVAAELQEGEGKVQVDLD